MDIALNVASVYLMVIGAFSVLIGSLYNETSGGDLTKPWHKRYWWYSWRPFYINTKTHKLVIKWNYITMQEGFMTLKVKFEVFGFIFVLIGAIFQLLN